MSQKTYNTESKQALEQWLDSCPRELANVIYVSISQIKNDEGDYNHIGFRSVIETRRGDALSIIKQAALDIVEWHDKLDEGDE